MFSKMNKMLPIFHKSSSDYTLMIVVSMYSMPSLHSRKSLHRKKPKVRPNEGKCVKIKR